MFRIHLHNLRFFSHHGVHEEETILGADYEVNVDIDFTTDQTVRNLQDTINYVKIYNKIQDVMNNPEMMLESLAQTISRNIYTIDNRIKFIQVNIYKLSPPINKFSGRVGITYSIEF